MKYVKKAIPVEACALDRNHDEWLKDAIKKQIVKMNTDGTAEIETLEGVQKARKNDFIIKGVRGEIYPCRRDIFEETYEELVKVSEVEQNETVKMRGSADYKERFKAEYYQTKIRYDKLHQMLIKYEAGTLDFTPTCDIEILERQARYMGNYLKCLEIRAEIEKIKLEV